MSHTGRAAPQPGMEASISYLLIIAVAFVVLAATANFHAVTAIQHHIADMEAALRGGPDCET